LNTTRTTRHINAPPAADYAALVNAQSLAAWRSPDDMHCEVHEFEVREGGTFRISLTYDTPTGTGKTTPHTDTYHGHISQLVPGEKVVEVVEFESADPTMAGLMTVTTLLSEADGGTDVVVLHEDIPDGVTPADNEVGTRMALAKLAALVEVG
jgi:uncharacterized protein YndB with AHSA1/START domain